LNVPAAQTLDAIGAQTRKATPPGNRIVPIPERADGKTAMAATGLLSGIIAFSFRFDSL
jgi:hypothetical protein